MKKLLSTLLVFILAGCTTVATQSEDGKKLSIKGAGTAKFENGAEITGGQFIKLPQIELEK